MQKVNMPSCHGQEIFFGTASDGVKIDRKYSGLLRKSSEETILFVLNKAIFNFALERNSNFSVHLKLKNNFKFFHILNIAFVEII